MMTMITMIIMIIVIVMSNTIVIGSICIISNGAMMIMITVIINLMPASHVSLPVRRRFCLAHMCTKP